MSFSVQNSDIILCSGEKILIYNTNTEKETYLIIPNLIVDKNTKQQPQHNNADTDTIHGITSIEFSKDGKYICVCTNRKQLCLYDRLNDNKLVSNRTLARSASRVRLTPSNDVIVADRSGDAYLYSSSRPEEPGELILGHLSMLLDVLVTEDSRYVITADRDEKIRVSHFPNAYNIEAFCLGHSKFVSNIGQLPHDTSVLVSAGGDGLLKFWRYQEGRILKTIDFTDKIQIEDVENLNKNLKDIDLVDSVNNLPVKCLGLSKLNDDDSSILALGFYGSGIILVYRVTGKIGEDGDCVEFIQSILEEKEEPLEISIFQQQLWLLFKSGIKVFKFDCNNKAFVLDDEFNCKLEKLNNTWRTLIESASKQIFYPVLYKRKFDNVQEYKEKKKSRIDSKNSSNVEK